MGPKLDKIGEDKLNIKEASVPTEEDRAYSKANHLRNLLNYQNGAVINQLTSVGWGLGGIRCLFFLSLCTIQNWFTNCVN
jgi:hypothetical protein